MMNKRGASHADWAISLGIFLLYILSMLMLIQPGVQPFYRENELLSIVTGNYKADTSFTFYKTLLVIDTAGMEFTQGAGSYKVLLDADFPFSENVNYYAVTDENLNPLENFEIQEGWGVVRFNAPIAPDENRFYIISNKLADGTSKPYTDRGEINEGEPGIANGVNFTLTIGSTEVLQGVSADLLMKNIDAGGIYCQDDDGEAQAAKYAALKQKWSFPSSKDFMVFYANNASAQYNIADFPEGDVIPVCRHELPYEQASVVVEEWATRMLVPNAGDEYIGETVPIRMVARVW